MSEHVIEVPYSHLRPGLILDAPAGTHDFLVLLGDTESRAQLLNDDTGRPLLRVGGYMTADGTVVDERVWTVRDLVRHGTRLHLHLGPSIP
ncbi:hypothetical protein [Nonomuraea sp. NPDC049309]|uniref:hypothetical protein n=1 Tax=Nonomuraea sp. NPDC049309 TaxID=3364350 RepID=UPI0037162FBB